MRRAADEASAEFAQRDAHIQVLVADAEDTRAHMQADIDRLRADMEAGPAQLRRRLLVPMLWSCSRWCESGTCGGRLAPGAAAAGTQGSSGAAAADASLCAAQAEVAQVRRAMQERVEAAVAESQAKATGLQDARQQNVHFSARVVALNSRIGALTRQLKEAGQRSSSSRLRCGPCARQ